MGLSSGELVEIYLENGLTGGRLLCSQILVPAPGQYQLAHDAGSDAPLPVPVFSAGSIPGGFLAAPPIPPAWRPGMTLSLRGPLGRGFSMPATARCAALVAWGETAARLKPLLAIALRQGASVVLVSDLDVSDLPPEVEVQPVAALADVAKWADYLALDMHREYLPELREGLGLDGQDRVKYAGQVLVVTSMPCGGVAECAICAVSTRHSWKLACKDGPVFGLEELI